MCVVSMVVDRMAPLVPSIQWTQTNYSEYVDILKKLDALDLKLGLMECDKEKLEKHLLEIKDLISKRANGKRKGVSIRTMPVRMKRATSRARKKKQ